MERGHLSRKSTGSPVAETFRAEAIGGRSRKRQVDIDSSRPKFDWAMERESEAERFYLDIASTMAREWMRTVFEDVAREERGHRAKLAAVKEGRLLLTSDKTIQDLKIAEYLVDVNPSEDMDYQKALIVAMKREKASFRLYSDLARIADDDSLRTTFLALAQEEAKHKLRFEVEYDDLVLSEN